MDNIKQILLDIDGTKSIVWSAETKERGLYMLDHTEYNGLIVTAVKDDNPRQPPFTMSIGLSVEEIDKFCVAYTNWKFNKLREKANV